MDRTFYHQCFVCRDIKLAIVSVILFPISMWFMWAYFICRIMYYNTTSTITLKTRVFKACTTSDKNHALGYRITSYKGVSDYSEFPATPQELRLNKRKKNVFVFCLIMNIILIAITIKHLIND